VEGTADGERRRYRRLTVRIEVSYHWEGDGRVRTALATTLGAGGLFIPTEEPLARGTELRVRVRLPGTSRVYELPAQGVWANDATTPGVPESGHGMGIAFRDPAAQMRLARQLETWTPS
jgi:Tfp pilus assembly protein PilZ